MSYKTPFWQKCVRSLCFFYDYYLILCVVNIKAFGLILAGNLRYLNQTVKLKVDETGVEDLVIKVNAICCNIETMKEQLNDTMGIQLLHGIAGIFLNCSVAAYSYVESLTNVQTTTLPLGPGFYLYLFEFAALCFIFDYIIQKVYK